MPSRRIVAVLIDDVSGRDARSTKAALLPTRMKWVEPTLASSSTAMAGRGTTDPGGGAARPRCPGSVPVTVRYSRL